MDVAEKMHYTLGVPFGRDIDYEQSFKFAEANAHISVKVTYDWPPPLAVVPVMFRAFLEEPVTLEVRRGMSLRELETMVKDAMDIPQTSNIEIKWLFGPLKTDGDVVKLFDLRMADVVVLPPATRRVIPDVELGSGARRRAQKSRSRSRSGRKSRR
jgi:hypothetical protein